MPRRRHGRFVDTYEGIAADNYSFTNSIFWGNAPGRDFATACGSGCDAIKVDVSHSLVQTKYAKDGGISHRVRDRDYRSSRSAVRRGRQGRFPSQAGSPAIGKASDGTDLGAYGRRRDTASATAARRPKLPRRLKPPRRPPRTPARAPRQRRLTMCPPRRRPGTTRPPGQTMSRPSRRSTMPRSSARSTPGMRFSRVTRPASTPISPAPISRSSARPTPHPRRPSRPQRATPTR